MSYDYAMWAGRRGLAGGLLFAVGTVVAACGSGAEHAKACNSSADCASDEQCLYPAGESDGCDAQSQCVLSSTLSSCAPMCRTACISETYAQELCGPNNTVYSPTASQTGCLLGG